MKLLAYLALVGFVCVVRADRKGDLIQRTRKLEIRLIQEIEILKQSPNVPAQAIEVLSKHEEALGTLVAMLIKAKDPRLLSEIEKKLNDLEKIIKADLTQWGRPSTAVPPKPNLKRDLIEKAHKLAIRLEEQIKVLRGTPNVPPQIIEDLTREEQTLKTLSAMLHRANDPRLVADIQKKLIDLEKVVEWELSKLEGPSTATPSQRPNTPGPTQPPTKATTKPQTQAPTKPTTKTPIKSTTTSKPTTKTPIKTTIKPTSKAPIKKA